MSLQPNVSDINTSQLIGEQFAKIPSDGKRGVGDKPKEKMGVNLPMSLKPSSIKRKL